MDKHFLVTNVTHHLYRYYVAATEAVMCIIEQMKRAYGSEPILFTSSPITSALKPTLRAFTKLRWHVLAVAVAALLVSGGVMGWLLVQRSSANATIPTEIQKSVDFSLYEPGWLPEGSALDRKSFAAEHQTVTFTVDGRKGEKLIFSEQPQPPLIDFDAFYDKQFGHKTSFDTAIGQAVVGISKDTLFGSITTGQTWIFVKAHHDMDRVAFERIMQNMHATY